MAKAQPAPCRVIGIEPIYRGLHAEVVRIPNYPEQGRWEYADGRLEHLWQRLGRRTELARRG